MNSKFLTNKSFYKSSAFYIVSSGIASIANYALYPILAKIISPSELGDVGVVSAVIVQVGSVLLAFNIISIYLSSRETEQSAINKLEIIQRGLVKISAVLSLLIILTLPYTKELLNIGSYLPLVGLSLLLVAIIPTTIWTGYLLGQKALPLVGVYNLVNSFAKLAGAVLFALAGFGAGGAVFGVLFGYIVSLAVLKSISPYRLPSIVSVFKKEIHALNVKDLKFYIFEALAVTGFISVFYSVDIISAKLLFNPDVAGVYVGASTIASSVYYIIMVLAWVVLPHYSHKNILHNNRLLLKAILLASLVGLSFAGLSLIFGKDIINLTLGSEYLAVSGILWKVGISQAVIAITAMVAFSMLVLRKKGALLLSTLTLMFTIAAVAVAPRNYDGLANALIAGEALGWGVFMISFKLRGNLGLNHAKN